VRGLNGLDTMRAMRDGQIPFASIAQTHFLLVEVNPMGTVHGGWYATLLDSALGCAVHTRCRPAKATPRPS
jgi:acyl-coenzyme A thioesterase PaaI-like protein